MKRKILVMIAAIAVVLILPLAANAASVSDLTFDKTTGTITGCNESAAGELVIPAEIDGVRVTEIGNEAFGFCHNLTSVTIPEGLTSIDNTAFLGCSSLTSISIPDSVTSIGHGAFVNCGNLNISVEANNMAYCDIDGVLFTKNKKTLVAYAKDKIQPQYIYIIPDGVTNIGDDAFYRCSGLTSISIPDSVTSIGEGAFADCSGLTSISIPDGVTSIGDEAFGGCDGLTSISIPDDVTSIGERAFCDCGKLNISVKPNNKNYCDINGVLFTKDKKTIAAYAKDKIQPEYVIPNGVMSIGDGAFYYCSSLTSISIPDGVTSIGDGAFYYCSSLTSISIPDGVTSIGDCAFYGCKSLTSISIPDSVTSIGDEAFSWCEGLTSISIPDGVTSIGELAFAYCSSLTNISIPGSVTSIGYGAFGSCEGLTSISIPDGVTSIGDAAFAHCYRLTSISIPNSVTSIGEEAFNWCIRLTDVYYSGTEQEWKQIEIGIYNEDLLNANIHYNTATIPIKPLEVKPVEYIINAEENKIEIPVTVVDPERAEELNDVELFVAEYDENGRFIRLTRGSKSEVKGDTITISADIPEAENYKFLLWDGNYVPLMDAIEDISL